MGPFTASNLFSKASSFFSQWPFQACLIMPLVPRKPIERPRAAIEWTFDGHSFSTTHVRLKWTPVLRLPHKCATIRKVLFFLVPTNTASGNIASPTQKTLPDQRVNIFNNSVQHNYSLKELFLMRQEIKRSQVFTYDLQLYTLFF